MRFWKKRCSDSLTDEAAISDDARYENDLVHRMIAEGRSIYTDPEFLSYMAVKSADLADIDASCYPKYRPVERPEYIEGRRMMAERGANLYYLDSVILRLRYGCRLPRRCKPQRLHGDMEGLMECRIDGRRGAWFLRYGYDEDEARLYLIDTGTREECDAERHLPKNVHASVYLLAAPIPS